MTTTDYKNKHYRAYLLYLPLNVRISVQSGTFHNLHKPLLPRKKDKLSTKKCIF